MHLQDVKSNRIKGPETWIVIEVSGLIVVQRVRIKSSFFRSYDARTLHLPPGSGGHDSYTDPDMDPLSDPCMRNRILRCMTKEIVKVADDVHLCLKIFEEQVCIDFSGIAAVYLLSYKRTIYSALEFIATF
ncbi:hypothetical protein KSS87_019654 [Heliosperma pusillum]|nr:hypothetical protein KSS87_019654 [Heliosperma pusillum]